MKTRVYGRQTARGIVILLVLFCFIGITWADDFSADLIATLKNTGPDASEGQSLHERPVDEDGISAGNYHSAAPKLG